MLNDNHILLIHPLGYSAGSAKHDITRVANLMPPLGLASIAAYLEQKGLSADIVDCFAHPDSDDRIRELLRDKRPAYIGVSVTTSSFVDGVRIIELAKSELPGIKGIMGGAHISALRERVLEATPQVDYTVIGEGEEAVEGLMRSGGSGLTGIPGIVYRDGDDVLFSGHRGKGIELDSLPFPAYEKLSGYPDTYKLPIFNYPTAPNASCISSRGCPYECSYCDRSVFRKSFRFNSAEYLYEHLRYLKERWGIRHINFYDDQFTFHRRRVKEFCDMMIERPLNMTFNCAVRAEHVDLELLKQMKGAGCWMISLGIETGDPELLARHRQNADLDLLADRIRDIKQAGIRTKGLLMMGLPGETEESIKRSMAYVASLPIDDFNLTKFTPFPGSPVHENIRDYGTFNDDPALMDCMHFVFVPHGFTEERLEKLYGQFYASHIKRPSVWMGYVAMLWKSPDSWKRFILNLGSFLAFVRSSERISQEP
ncbi:MAG: radical SAM protein [Verrucomicrobia bacterium]|nr:radical SAM protein [Verrucomicrobiota bacterium]